MTIELGRGRATSTATPEAFFARWIDHDSWRAWSPDTEWVHVEGPVRAGATGTMKPVGGPKLRFIVSTCEPGREYADTTRLPGARLHFRHTVEPSATDSELGVLVTVSGLLSWLWARVLGGGFLESVPADLDRLVALVESDAAAVRG